MPLRLGLLGCTSSRYSLAYPDHYSAQGVYRLQYKRPAPNIGQATRDYVAAKVVERRFIQVKSLYVNIIDSTVYSYLLHGYNDACKVIVNVVSPNSLVQTLSIYLSAYSNI